MQQRRRRHHIKNLTLACLLTAGVALAQEKMTFDIPEQDAAAAIQSWAKQSGLQVFAADEHLRGIRTHAVHGEYSALQAVQLMIEGTGLEAVSTGEKTVTIRRPKSTTAVNDPAPSLAGLEEVVITGSRIKRTGFDTLEAALVTDSAEMQRRAYTNVGQALEATPGFATSDSSPISSSPSNEGIGQTFVNFFGLGSQRTLTLVNGRRFVSSNTASGSRGNTPVGSQVDLNLIPAGLVERVETIAIGGAPIYGSDAISGTVNVILKDHFQGIETSAQYGITERGDGTDQTYRVLMGGNFNENRGNAVISVEYSKQDGMLMHERKQFTNFLANPLDTGPNDGISALEAVNDFRFGILTEGGLPYDPNGGVPGLLGGNYVYDGTTPLQFGRDGNLVPFDHGVIKDDLGIPGTPIFTQGGDGLDPSLHFSLAAPLKRTLVNGMAHYDVAPHTRLFVEASFAHTEAIEISELLAFASPGVLGGPLLEFSVDNPFLTSQARQALIANGLTTFAVDRNLNDITNRMPGETQIDLYRVVGGLEGDLALFDQEWSWNLSYNYGRSRNTSGFAFISPTRLQNAIDAVLDPKGSGQIVCASVATNPDCVPINLFGEDRFSDAAADYVTDIGDAVSLNTLQVVNANLSGKLPFGFSDPVAFNLGVERRKEDASFTPDATREAGLLLLGPGRLASKAVSGGFETKEAYTELVVPVIASSQDFRAVKSFNIEGAARFVDNSIAGSDTTWSAGARFTPRLSGWADGLLLRGVFTHAIRAPAVTELFSGITPVANGISDPCDRLNVDDGFTPELRAANCAAALAAVGGPPPSSFNPTTDTVSVFGSTSGNQNLENEIADSWSLGFVYQPAALPNLRMAVDWSDIRLKNGIESLDIDTLMAACYDSASFPNDATCSTFHRLTAAEAAAQPGAPRSAGEIADGYRSGYVNVSGIDFAGLIFDASFILPLQEGAAGTMRLGTRLSFVNKFDVHALPGTPTDTRVGTVGMPKYRANVGVGYTLRGFDADLQAIWRSATLSSLTGTFEDNPLNEYPSYAVLNATVGYRFTDSVRTQLAIANLLDKAMPAAAAARNNFGSFDPLGRRYFLTLFATF